MKTEVKVSVIVPVYNAEKYLSCLIDSLLAQTLKEIEFIFINDGSKDNSLEILKEYAKKDERIVIIDKENAGVSSARNDGLKIAKGEFIGFVDSDDFVSEDMYESLYKKAIKEKADIVSCGHRIYSSKMDIPKFNGCETVLSREEAIYNLIGRKILGMSACTKLYSKKILTNVFFPEQYKVNEDRLFTFKAIRNADKIAVIKDTPYYYRMNENSVSHSGFKLSTIDALYISQDMHNIILQDYPQMTNVSDLDIAMSAYFVLVAMYRDNVYADFPNEHKLLVNTIKKLKLRKIKHLFTRSIYIQLLAVKYCEPFLRIVKKFILKKSYN